MPGVLPTALSGHDGALSNQELPAPAAIPHRPGATRRGPRIIGATEQRQASAFAHNPQRTGLLRTDLIGPKAAAMLTQSRENSTRI